MCQKAPNNNKYEDYNFLSFNKSNNDSHLICTNTKWIIKTQ